MKRFFTVLLAALLLCGCFTLAAADQTYTNAFSMGRYTVYVPDGWYGGYNAESDCVYVYGPSGAESGYGLLAVYDISELLTGRETEEMLWENCGKVADSVVSRSDGLLSPAEHFAVAGKTGYFCTFSFHGTPSYMVIFIDGTSLVMFTVMNISEADARTVLSGITIG